MSTVKALKSVIAYVRSNNIQKAQDVLALLAVGITEQELSIQMSSLTPEQVKVYLNLPLDEQEPYLLKIYQENTKKIAKENETLDPKILQRQLVELKLEREKYAKQKVEQLKNKLLKSLTDIEREGIFNRLFESTDSDPSNPNDPRTPEQVAKDTAEWTKLQTELMNLAKSSFAIAHVALAADLTKEHFDKALENVHKKLLDGELSSKELAAIVVKYIKFLEKTPEGKSFTKELIRIYKFLQDDANKMLAPKK